MQVLVSQSNKRHQPVFLVGPMGSGKTTLGRALSLALQVPFIDVDEEIIKSDGRSIPQIFKEDGEAGFRDIESRTLQAVLERERGLKVISGGGGVILRPENRQLIVEKTTCVYLYCHVETQFARVAGDMNRPVIAGEKDQRARLKAVFDIRDPFFRDMQHIAVDTGAHTLASCVELMRQSILF